MDFLQVPEPTKLKKYQNRTKIWSCWEKVVKNKTTQTKLNQQQQKETNKKTPQATQKPSSNQYAERSISSSLPWYEVIIKILWDTLTRKL